VAYDDLREWIKALDKAGELKRIRHEVDPVLEIAEITDRASKIGRNGPGTKNGLKGHAPGGPALLFENVKGYPGATVLMNQFGSERRMKLALGVDSLDEIAGRIRALLEVKSPEGFIDKLKMLPMLAEAGKYFPKTVASKDAPCKQVILRENFSVLDFPVLQCWPLDGGRFITLPCVVTRDPKTGAPGDRSLSPGLKTGKRNVGMYRMQVYDGQTTGMHWQRQKNAAEHLRERLRVASGQTAADHVKAMAETAGGTANIALREAKGDRMEVAVAIGTDPATTFAAVVPAPPEVEEYLIAGFLRQSPVELVKCETVDLEVPAYAEIVLEGYVKLDELRMEGPFGDHTGFYSLADQFPLFHVTALTHRSNPIYPTTIVGKPPQEDCYMGKATERLFLPLIKMFIPEVVDYDLPWFGVFHNFAFVSIRKRYALQARKVMSAIWGLGQMMFTKIIVVVDEHVNVHNHEEVLFHVGANVHPGRDVVFAEGPTDLLDHAAPVCCVGHKMGIDATRKFPEEGHPRPWPDEMLMSQNVIDLVTRRWQEYGIGKDPGPVGTGLRT
jgi:4-hydroxy-3-polyprenylbenzoate decarboxylase